MNIENLVSQIKEKYEKLGENPETYLKGLLQAKPINFWDYIEVDTLLSLQKPRTNFKDEEIFIMYHQVTELFLKLMLHEIKQVAFEANYTEEFLLNKFTRIIRYTQMLINSFDIMKDGMSYDDYNIFRATLAPASGFQSAQFRFIELHCTGLENLMNEAGRERINSNPTTEEYFEHIYWKDAGLNRKTGKKNLTLTLFEEKYLHQFISLANAMKGKTIADKLNELPNKSEVLLNMLREFDHLYNVAWPMVHLNTAKHYLDSKNENQQATGGSEWKKYLMPKFQQRKFFPAFWSNEEKEKWGESI
ncbi:MAG: tryptophan 2,3-dioxygenase [Bacteroidia bacterium]|nr:tryptophan 2,3-dioxygenase [Bacteroidia bacterium]